MIHAICSLNFSGSLIATGFDISFDETMQKHLIGDLELESQEAKDKIEKWIKDNLVISVNSIMTDKQIEQQRQDRSGGLNINKDLLSEKRI